MTRDEFLASARAHGATLGNAASAHDIELTCSGLQRLRAATLPAYMREFYTICGGVILGNAFIFGPTEIPNELQYPMPPITTINDEIRDLSIMRGMTVWGRNDLFWFGFDAFGTCYMLDNLNLNKLRKYDDPYRAMIDCIAIGKL